MSVHAVPKHSTAAKLPDQLTNNPVDEEMFSDIDFSEQSTRLLRQSGSQTMFLTKTSGLMVLYSLFPVGVNLFILFRPVDSKIMYRTMNMALMTWVYLALSLLCKFLGGCLNRLLSGLQALLFILDCVFTSLTFFGLYWFFDNINASAYEYSGHYVIIGGFCLCALSMGFLFSTLIRLRSSKYSVVAGLFFMPLFVIIALVVIANVFTIHTMKAYQYTLVGLWFTLAALYISLNSKFILSLRLEKYYDHEIVYAFFCYNTDIVLFFWIDLCKSLCSGKKKKNRGQLRQSNEMA